MEPTSAPELAPSGLPEASEPAPAPAMSAPKPLDMAPAHLAERVSIGPAPEWIAERSVEQKPAGQSGTDPILLLDRQYRATGRETYHRTVRRLDTIQAVRELAQWRQEFDPVTDRIVVHSLVVSRGDRRVENAKVERLRVLQREENLEYLVINGLATVMVLLEDVRTGDVVDLSFTLHRETRVFHDRFWCFATVPSQVPIHSYCLSVRFPAGHAMQWKSNDKKLEPAIREDGAETEWLWQTSNSVGEREYNIPPWHIVERWIQVTDINSWAEVSAAFYAAWVEGLEEPEIVRIAQSIAAESPTPSARIIRALNYVQDDIRYLSINDGLGGQIPSPPGNVASRGFGDCKDKTFLATHLLRRLGISARPVLVNAHLYRGIQEFLPTPNAFDHVVVEYELDGQRRWVDVTVPMQGGTALKRPGVRFQVGLPIGPEVENLEAIVTDTKEDQAELRETYLIDTAGRTSSLKVLLTASGRDAEEWRQRLAIEGVDTLARKRLHFYNRLYPGATRVGAVEWRDDRERNEFTLGEVFDLQDVIVPTKDGRTCLFKFSAHVIQSTLAYHLGGKRKHPWALPHPYQARHIIEIDSPGLTQALPVGKAVRSAAFRYQCECKQRQGMATITYTLRTEVEEVLPAQFETYKKNVEEAWPSTSIIIQLPLGGVVPWKKRAPENVLPTERRPGSIAPRKTPADTAAKGPDQERASSEIPAVAIAPALASNAAGKASIGPRKEKNSRQVETRAAGERFDFRRPNPTAIPPPLPGEIRRSSRSSRSGTSRRRNSQRSRDRMFLTLAFVLGGVIVLGMVIVLVRFL